MRLVAGPYALGRPMDLARQETECCPFFAFTFEVGTGTVSMIVTALSEAAPVLETSPGSAWKSLTG